MAVKTFKTRIKLKYDALNEFSNFPALKGEMLLGHKDNKVYASIGTDDNSHLIKPLSIDGENVVLASFNINGTNLTNAKGAFNALETWIVGNTTTITNHGTRIEALETAVGTGGSVDTKITNAINALDVTDITGMAASKTLLTLTQTDGKIAATFQDIEIPSSKVSDFATSVKNLIVTGETNGTIKVNDSEVHVAGLGSAAYTDLGDYATAAQGAKADRALQSISASGDGEFVTTTVSVKGTGDTTQTVGVSVTTHDIATADATADNGDGLATAADVKSYVSSQLTGIVGAMVYKGTVSSDANLPTANTSGVQAGWTYVVSTAGTYNGQSCEIGDMIIVQSVENGTIKFNIVNGENQVSSANAEITAGANAATTVATVDGTNINVKVGVTAGNAVIAKSVDGVVTLKAGLTQNGTSGSIENNTGDDITLAKVATTGKAVDVSYNTNSNVSDALDSLNTAVNTTLPDSIDAISDNTITGDDAIKIASGTTVGSDNISITHVKPGAISTAAVMVGRDEYGHVVTGDALTASDIAYGDVQDGTVESAIDSLKQKDEDHDTAIATNTASITTLNGDENTNGSVKNTVATTINSALNGLDNSTNISTDNTTGAKTITNVTQSNGKIQNGTQSVTIGKAGQTNQIYDLDENTADNYIIFDCGTSAGWPTPEA